MRKLSLIIPYYRNPKMLAEHHCPQWHEYPDDVLGRLTIILVDDCSPEPALPILQRCHERVKSRIRLFRIHDDIPWNQHGARNLGAHIAQDEWLFLADMDRILLTFDIRQIMCRPLDTTRHYKPYGVQMGPRLKSDEKIPVNQFLVTKNIYWMAGGYDEDYCGTYGGDGPLLKAMAKIAPLEMMPDVRLIRYHTDMKDLDATTTDLERKGEFQKRQHRKIKNGNTKPANHMRFQWEEQSLQS